MAIHIYCTRCYTSNSMEAKVCSNCGLSFGRNKKYRVCVSIDRKRVTRVVENLTLAREAETAIKADLLRGDLDISQKKKPVPTLGEVWKKYLSWAKGQKKTWDDDFFNYKKHIEPRFGKKQLDAISAMEVNRLKLEMRAGETKDGKPYMSKRGKPFSEATIKHQLVLLSRLYQYANGPDFKYKGDSPFDHKQVVMPHLDNELPRFLTQEQLASLWNALETWPDKTSVAFVKFLLFTGVRRGTLFLLTWEEVDFERDMVTLSISHRRKGTETVMKKVCRDAMEVLMSLPRTSKYVFPGKDGEQRTDFKGPWLRIRKVAGLPEKTRLHDLRHTFGSYHAMAGTPPQVLQELMNHRDFRTTLKYAKLSPDVVNDVAARSGELLTPKRTGDNIRALKMD